MNKTMYDYEEDEAIIEHYTFWVAVDKLFDAIFCGYGGSMLMPAHIRTGYVTSINSAALLRELAACGACPPKAKSIAAIKVVERQSADRITRAARSCDVQDVSSIDMAEFIDIVAGAAEEARSVSSRVNRAGQLHYKDAISLHLDAMVNDLTEIAGNASKELEGGKVEA